MQDQKPPKKKTDIFLSAVNQQLGSYDEFVEQGFQPQLHSKDKYEKNEQIRAVFTDEKGNFQKDKFDQTYQDLRQFYDGFAEHEFTPTSVDYVLDDTTAGRMLGATPVTKESKVSLKGGVQNPSGQTFGITEIGKLDQGNRTVASQAQRNNFILTQEGNYKAINTDSSDGITGVWDYFKYGTVAIAQDENKRLKTDLFGNAIYQNVDGKDLTGRQTLKFADSLTDETDFLNQYDFMDSDDKTKSITGQVFKTAAKIAPYFLPYVNVAYIGAQTAGAMFDGAAEISKSYYGFKGESADEQTIANNLQGFVNNFMTTGQSEEASASLMNFESLTNMASSVVGEIASQRLLFKLPAYVRTAASSSIVKKLKAANKAGDVVFNTASDILRSSKAFNAAVNTGQLGKELAMGRAASLLYGATVASKEIAQSATAQGLAPEDRAWMHLAGFVGSGLIYTALPHEKWILNGLGADAQKQAVTKVLKEKTLPKIAQIYAQKGTDAATKKVGVLRAFEKGAEETSKLFDDLATGSMRGVFGSGVAESVEEGTEVVFAEGLKSLYNSFNELGLTKTKKDPKKRFKTWEEDFRKNLLLSAVGGFMGGAYARSALFDKTSDQDLSLVDIVQRGQTQEYIDQVNKRHGSRAGIASRLHTMEVEGETDGVPVYKTAASDKDYTQNDHARDTLIGQIKAIEKTLEQKNLSQEDIQANFQLFKEDIEKSLFRNNLETPLLTEAIPDNPTEEELAGIYGPLLAQFKVLEQADPTGQAAANHYNDLVISRILADQESTNLLDDTLRLTKNYLGAEAELQQAVKQNDTSEDGKQILSDLQQKRDTAFTRLNELKNIGTVPNKAADYYFRQGLFSTNQFTYSAFGVKTENDFVDSKGELDQAAWYHYVDTQKTADMLEAFKAFEEFEQNPEMGKASGFAELLKLDTEQAPIEKIYQGKALVDAVATMPQAFDQLIRNYDTLSEEDMESMSPELRRLAEQIGTLLPEDTELNSLSEIELSALLQDVVGRNYEITPQVAGKRAAIRKKVLRGAFADTERLANRIVQESKGLPTEVREELGLTDEDLKELGIEGFSLRDSIQNLADSGDFSAFMENASLKDLAATFANIEAYLLGKRSADNLTQVEKQRLNKIRKLQQGVQEIAQAHANEKAEVSTPAVALSFAGDSSPEANAASDLIDDVFSGTRDYLDTQEKIAREQGVSYTDNDNSVRRQLDRLEKDLEKQRAYFYYSTYGTPVIARFRKQSKLVDSETRNSFLLQLGTDLSKNPWTDVLDKEIEGRLSSIAMLRRQIANNRKRQKDVLTFAPIEHAAQLINTLKHFSATLGLAPVPTPALDRLYKQASNIRSDEKVDRKAVLDELHDELHEVQRAVYKNARAAGINPSDASITADALAFSGEVNYSAAARTSLLRSMLSDGFSINNYRQQVNSFMAGKPVDQVLLPDQEIGALQIHSFINEKRGSTGAVTIDSDWQTGKDVLENHIAHFAKAANLPFTSLSTAGDAIQSFFFSLGIETTAQESDFYVNGEVAQGLDFSQGSPANVLISQLQRAVNKQSAQPITVLAISDAQRLTPLQQEILYHLGDAGIVKTVLVRNNSEKASEDALKGRFGENTSAHGLISSFLKSAEREGYLAEAEQLLSLQDTKTRQITFSNFRNDEMLRGVFIEPEESFEKTAQEVLSTKAEGESVLFVSATVLDAQGVADTFGVGVDPNNEVALAQSGVSFSQSPYGAKETYDYVVVAPDVDLSTVELQGVMSRTKRAVVMSSAVVPANVNAEAETDYRNPQYYQVSEDTKAALANLKLYRGANMPAQPPTTPQQGTPVPVPGDSSQEIPLPTEEPNEAISFSGVPPVGPQPPTPTPTNVPFEPLPVDELFEDGTVEKDTATQTEIAQVEAKKASETTPASAATSRYVGVIPFQTDGTAYQVIDAYNKIAPKGVQFTAEDAAALDKHYQQGNNSAFAQSELYAKITKATSVFLQTYDTSAIKADDVEVAVSDGYLTILLRNGSDFVPVLRQKTDLLQADASFIKTNAQARDFVKGLQKAVKVSYSTKQQGETKDPVGVLKENNPNVYYSQPFFIKAEQPDALSPVGRMAVMVSTSQPLDKLDENALSDYYTDPENTDNRLLFLDTGSESFIDLLSRLRTKLNAPNSTDVQRKKVLRDYFGFRMSPFNKKGVLRNFYKRLVETAGEGNSTALEIYEQVKNQVVRSLNKTSTSPLTKATIDQAVQQAIGFSLEVDAGGNALLFDTDGSALPPGEMPLAFTSAQDFDRVLEERGITDPVLANTYKDSYFTAFPLLAQQLLKSDLEEGSFVARVEDVIGAENRVSFDFAGQKQPNQVNNPIRMVNLALHDSDTLAELSRTDVDTLYVIYDSEQIATLLAEINEANTPVNPPTANSNVPNTVAVDTFIDNFDSTTENSRVLRVKGAATAVNMLASTKNDVLIGMARQNVDNAMSDRSTKVPLATFLQQNPAEKAILLDRVSALTGTFLANLEPEAQLKSAMDDLLQLKDSTEYANLPLQAKYEVETLVDYLSNIIEIDNYKNQYNPLSPERMRLDREYLAAQYPDKTAMPANRELLLEEIDTLHKAALNNPAHFPFLYNYAEHLFEQLNSNTKQGSAGVDEGRSNKQVGRFLSAQAASLTDLGSKTGTPLDPNPMLLPFTLQKLKEKGVNDVALSYILEANLSAAQKENSLKEKSAIRC